MIKEHHHRVMQCYKIWKKNDCGAKHTFLNKIVNCGRRIEVFYEII